MPNIKNNKKPGHSAAVKLLILDCDGVLVDSEPIVCRTYWSILSEVGYGGDLETFMREFSGVREEEIVLCVERSTGKTIGLIADEMRKSAFDALLLELPLGSAFSEIVKKSGVTTCVASNSDMRRLKFSVGRANLSDVLRDQIYSAEMVARGKPAPDILYYAAAQNGVSADECLVVEDSSSGIKAARTFGARVIAFAYRNHDPEAERQLLEAGAERVIYSADEILPDLLAGDS
ncbi:HAD family hydrolase [Roseibium marinum]|uniref:HAD superfamily hydrolase (TIGR01509 family) n=1 Tax=Roseibium marinum TaxID=281252 RepID=A0A2S3UL82_9HYPH|nr:HAD-IA family hydrolase [Roseibium marinum]POF28320.1 HAD superfamily hydrolase (TIGR01509 family) [Roseibium marinum]